MVGTAPVPVVGAAGGSIGEPRGRGATRPWRWRARDDDAEERLWSSKAHAGKAAHPTSSNRAQADGANDNFKGPPFEP